MVMNEPMYELMLGNSTAVRKVPDPEWKMEAGAVFLRKRFKQRQTWDRNRKQQLQEVLCKRKLYSKEIEIIERLKYEQL